MVLKAAELSAGKTSPIPYMNSLLSSWKSEGIFNPSQLAAKEPAKENYFRKQQKEERDAEFRRKVQSYYFNLREKAQDIAELT